MLWKYIKHNQNQQILCITKQQKYKLKLLKLISGNFPAINENLIISDKKIGVMKSFAYDYGLALVRQDFKELNNDLEIKNILSVISIL